MKIISLFRVALTAITSLLLLSTGLSGQIVILGASGTVTASTHWPFLGSDTENRTVSTLPFIESGVTASFASGAQHAIADYNFSSGLDSATFRMDFDLKNGSNEGDSVASVRSANILGMNSVIIANNSGVDIQYTFTGEFQLATKRQESTFGASLRDDSTLQFLFRNRQQSRHTDNQFFELGKEDGDWTNTLVGDRVGKLAAGQTARFEYFAGISRRTNFSDHEAGATATGFVQLDFDPLPLSVIPEPSTVGFAGMLGIAIYLIARRRLTVKGFTGDRGMS